MLCYEEMDVFHEDVGFLGADGGQNSSKGHGKIVEMAEMLQKEEAKTKKADSYAGWWYLRMAYGLYFKVQLFHGILSSIP